MWVKKWDAALIREQFDIPNCRALLRLDKEIRQPGKLPSYETHYYMSSLDPDVVPPSQFQSLIQGHGEVENCLHWQKDFFYREDKHVLGRDSWGEAWTILTNIALSLAQLLHRKERTLKEVRERCHANPKKTAKKLGLA